MSPIFPCSGEHIYSYLNRHLSSMAKDLGAPLELLASSLHVWPDFHGNRSPLADPTLRGAVRRDRLWLRALIDCSQICLCYLA